MHFTFPIYVHHSIGRPAVILTRKRNTSRINHRHIIIRIINRAMNMPKKDKITSVLPGSLPQPVIPIIHIMIMSMRNKNFVLTKLENLLPRQP